MCGRFAQVITHDRLQKLEKELNMIRSSEQIEFNYNVAPQQTVAAVVNQGQGAYTGFFRWGLIPSWSREVPTYQMINVRSDSVMEKPSFRGGLQRRRCLVPATGFYEWRKEDKQPYFIYSADSDLLFIAAIYDSWYGPDGSHIPSLGIMTTDANPAMRELHHRMPVLLFGEERLRWLEQANQDATSCLPMLKPCADSLIAMHPVSKLVNSTRNNSPECITEATSESQSGGDASIFDLMEEL